jgi:hypothetical protein
MNNGNRNVGGEDTGEEKKSYMTHEKLDEVNTFYEYHIWGSRDNEC